MLGFPSEVVAMMTNVAHDNAEVEDLSAAIFRYPSGALTQLTASVVHHGEDQKIVIQGEKARISAPWNVFASQSAENGFPQAENDYVRENSLTAQFHATPALRWTLHTAVYKSAITRSVVTLPVQRDDTFYRTGGLLQKAPHFYEKSASVSNFAEVGAIPLGKDLDSGVEK